MIIVIIASLFLATVSFAEDGIYKARSWTDENNYPEGDMFNLKSSAILFSGGGSRSFTASIGQLSALTELGLIDDIGYIAGISGGSWATLTYSYAQNITDDVLLSIPLSNPENLSMDYLKKMDDKCALKCAGSQIVIDSYGYMKDGADVAHAYSDGIFDSYFKPVGLERNQFWAYTSSQVQDIIKLNPSINEKDFVLPSNSKRPFPVVGTTLVGPENLSPFKTSNRNYSMIEITPLYIGQIYSQNIHYSNVNNNDGKYNVEEFLNIGGAVETFAVGRNSKAPRSAGMNEDVLDVPVPKEIFDISVAGAASSYAPGAFTEALNIPKIYDTSLFMDYWSPVDSHPQSRSFVWGDGGSLDDNLLIGMVRRGIKKVILFQNCKAPLTPSDQWDPSDPNTPLTTDKITWDFPYYFGQVPTDLSHLDEVAYDYSRNQIFNKEDFAPFVSGLQAAQATGKGAVYKMKLKTVENKWWGIKAGQEVELMMFYLSRAFVWESALPKDLYHLMVPKDGQEDVTQGVKHGPFKHFPYYPTKGGTLDSQQSNALAALESWVVKQYQKDLQDLLQN